jgi:hypothetical protein
MACIHCISASTADFNSVGVTDRNSVRCVSVKSTSVVTCARLHLSVGTKVLFTMVPASVFTRITVQ